MGSITTCAQKAGAVLADAPTFALEFSFAPRCLERFQRKACRLVHILIETGKMLADNFVCGVALEPLRAWIPAGHDALRIEHVDRIVGHRLDEQAVAPVVSQGRIEPFYFLH